MKAPRMCSYFPLALVMFSLPPCACSRLSVRTEVYNPDFDWVEDVATSIHRALTNLDADVDRAKPVFARTWEELRKRFPEIFAGDPSDFAQSYTEVVHDTVLAPNREEIQALLERAERLGARLADRTWSHSETGADSTALIRDVRELQRDYERLVEKLNRGLSDVAVKNSEDLERNTIEGLSVKVEDFQPERPEVKKLSSASGVKISNAEDIRGAVEALRVRVKEAVPQLYFRFNSVAAASLRESLSALAGTEILPLADPSVARIVAAPDEQWQAIYNRVLAGSWMGNAEIAVKMESLGEFHVKGVVFDPSQVAKATIDGLETAVSVAAAAYGVPLPHADEEDAVAGAEGPAKTESLSRARIRAQIFALRHVRAFRLAAKARLFAQVESVLESLRARTDGQEFPSEAAGPVAAAIREAARVLRTGRR